MHMRLCLVLLMVALATACAPKKVIRSTPPPPAPPLERPEPSYPRRIPSAEAPIPPRPEERRLQEPAPMPDPVADRLAAVLREAKDWPTQEASGMELFYRQWETRQYLSAMNTLALLYGLTTEDAARASLESLALARAETMPAAERDRMLAGNEARFVFPWALVAWARARTQLAEDPSRFEAVRPTLEAILERSSLVTKRVLHDQFLAMAQQGGRISAKDIIFFLPQSGPHAAVSRRILLGAQIAAKELETAGTRLTVRTIDAAASGALGELSALPAGSIVAGPLRKEDWDRVTSAALHRQLAFLTFLPSLPEEGRDGWRVLASLKDQTQALSQAMERFGASSAAILSPQDRFGMTMAPLFSQALEATGRRVTRTASYDPNQPATLGKIVAELLGATAKDKAYPLPPFEAVFLPDSLLKAQQAVAFFHYYNAGHLLLLGPQLWGHAADAPEWEASSFRLAVFASALDPTSFQAQQLAAAAASAGGKLDSWVALGYDTTRLFLLLPPFTGDATAFSTALGQASRTLNWTMAPIYWDASGHAHQELIPMQLTAEGLKRPDWEALRQLRDRQLQQRAAIPKS